MGWSREEKRIGRERGWRERERERMEGENRRGGFRREEKGEREV